MKQPKFSFIPERHLNKGFKPEQRLFTVNIFASGQMVFRAHDIAIYELADKFIRLFVDTENKVIGWSIINGATELEVLSDCRKLVLNQNGIITISIRKMLRACGIPDGTKMSNLQVKIYKSPTMEYDVHYVELPKDLPAKKEEETVNI